MSSFRPVLLNPTALVRPADSAPLRLRPCNLQSKLHRTWGAEILIEDPDRRSRPCRDPVGTWSGRPGVLQLSPFLATDPKKCLLTPIIATLPKPPSRKSFACHTCKLPRGDSCQPSNLHTFRGSNDSSIYSLSFHILAHSFALPKITTPLHSSVSALFAENTRGGGLLDIWAFRASDVQTCQRILHFPKSAIFSIP
jgi:hypothetical protein